MNCSGEECGREILGEPVMVPFGGYEWNGKEYVVPADAHMMPLCDRCVAILFERAMPQEEQVMRGGDQPSSQRPQPVDRPALSFE